MPDNAAGIDPYYRQSAIEGNDFQSQVSRWYIKYDEISYNEM